MERTLIDITVRPFYAGGSQEVLPAYAAAAGRVSIETLASMLGKVDYTYPYHQAIGFYIEQSRAYPGEDAELFRIAPMEFDFYLEYEMNDPAYSRRWRLYYPRGLSK